MRSVMPRWFPIPLVALGAYVVHVLLRGGAVVSTPTFVLGWPYEPSRELHDGMHALSVTPVVP